MLKTFAFVLTVVIISCSIGGFDIAQEQNTVPEKITLCQLKSDPARYNHKLIEVTGFISHGFEDFSIFDPDCASHLGVWLEYGGTEASGTMYCCGVTAQRTRPKQLVVEKISIPLVDDNLFHKFDQALQRRPDSVVRATIVGRFFSGKQVKYPGGTFWSGYGHMGCCSLLAIQQVMAVDSQDRDDLDYGASMNQPNIDKEGCGYKFLKDDIEDGNSSIHFQKLADEGQRPWSFDNPQRVATEGLARLIHVEENTITGMQETHKAQGRIVYQWSPKSKAASYMVVVSRPYLLSFYTKDKNKVAWIVAAAYESSCGGDNSVTLISLPQKKVHGRHPKNGVRKGRKTSQ